MKKNFKKAVALALASVSATSLVACGPTNKGGGENNLQIFVANFGYGVDWLDDMITAFKNSDWVNAKYPDGFTVAIPMDDKERGLPIKYIEDGYTNYDLLFSCQPASKLDEKLGSKILYEDLTSLYKTPIPGEGTATIESKMKTSYKVAADRDISADNEVYREFAWVGGTYGFVYNSYLVDTYLGENYEMPKTTFELTKMGDALNEQTGAPKLFLVNQEASYWKLTAYDVFLAQYLGEADLWRHYEGKNKEGKYDVEIMNPEKEKGSLRAIEAIEEMISRDGAYANLSQYYKEYGVAQGEYLRGNGVMMAMGDWFDSEMEAFKSDPNNQAYINPNTKIEMMKNPVLSAIVETLDLYTAGKEYSALTKTEKATWDEKLVEIIDAINAGQTELTGVSANDFAKVKEAMGVKANLGGHLAYIPGYADAKGLAKDFLLFMASNEGIETFMKSTDGITTAFNYTVDQTSSLWNGFSDMNKFILGTQTDYDWYVGVGYATQLTKKGPYSLDFNYGPSNSIKGKTLESLFCSESSTDRMSAQDVAKAKYVYYSYNNNAAWNQLLIDAGLSN